MPLAAPVTAAAAPRIAVIDENSGLEKTDAFFRLCRAGRKSHDGGGETAPLAKMDGVADRDQTSEKSIVTRIIVRAINRRQ
jgi:hypothetical protein